jgi:serine/threonine protein kinase
VTEDENAEVIFDKVEAIRCAKCGAELDVSALKTLSHIQCPKCKSNVTVPGRIGQFLIIRQLGAGAMGTVVEALDEQLHRRVAIKVIRLGGGEESDRKQMLAEFLNEARALASMNHPNVVHVHSIGEHHKQPFIVMELVSGRERLDVAIGRGEQMDERRLLRLAIDVANGLAGAARLNLVHGDIKPQNILITNEGVAKVVDFGLVGRAGMGQGEEVRGTPYYIAPERAQSKPVDARADMFSLGATLWHLLAGKPPFRGKSVVEVVMTRLKKPAADIREERPDVSEPTAKALATMLATSPADRYPDYATLIAALRAAEQKLSEPADGEAAMAGLLSASRRSKSGSMAVAEPGASGSARFGATTSRAMARTSPVNKKEAMSALIPLVVAGVVILGVIATVMWSHSIEKVFTKAPPPDPTLHLKFDSAALPAGVTLEGQPASFEDGHYLLKPGANASTSLSHEIDRKDFDLVVTLDAIEWDLNAEQQIKLAILDGKAANLLEAVLSKSKADRPVLKILGQSKAQNFSISSPTDVKLRLVYQSDSRMLRLYHGTGGAEAIQPHPAGAIQVPDTASEPRRFVLTVARGPEPTTPRLEVGVSQISLGPIRKNPPTP